MWFDSRLDNREEKISELEDIAIETTQKEKHKNETKNKTKSSSSEMWDSFKKQNYV